MNRRKAEKKNVKSFLWTRKKGNPQNASPNKWNAVLNNNAENVSVKLPKNSDSESKKSQMKSVFGKKYPRNVPLNTQNDFWTTLPKDFLQKTKLC